MCSNSENPTSANHCQEFLAPFRRADFFCLNEAKGHAVTTNDALRAAIAVACHGGKPSERKRFRRQARQSDVVVHKWRLFRALTEAKTPLGVTDRALSVLHALLSFHQETALTLTSADQGAETQAGETSAGIVVFPSNRELSIRAHGMAPATLRRHLACLVEAGLIIRRDSPNGKRFARRGQGGEIESAFGFDLTPLVARAAEIENLAEEVRAENKAIRLLRERITLLRRDIVKMIAMGIEEAVPGAWESFTCAMRRCPAVSYAICPEASWRL